MRFLIFNIVVVAALAFLLMNRPSVELARAPAGDMAIPKAPITETPVAFQPQQHTPTKPEPAPEMDKPKSVTEVPPMPPAQEVPVRVTHKPARDVSRDVSADLTERAERLKAEIIERQTAPVATVAPAPTQTAAAPTESYDKAVNRRKALMDLASDMENMFVEKMMR